jgi:pimeloyl-ACP methyl ester carboxylesterase
MSMPLSCSKVYAARSAFALATLAAIALSIPAAPSAQAQNIGPYVASLTSPKVAPKIFVLMQGIDSALSSSDIKRQTTPDFDSVKSDIQAVYPAAQFLTYSYAGSTKKGAPMPYTCVTTLTTPLSIDIQMLGTQIQRALVSEPNADVYLVAHSMGGIIAYGYLAALQETTGIVAPLPQSNLKGVITLDSPLGGISNDPTYLGGALTFYEASCAGFNGEVPTAITNMATIFTSTDQSTPPDSSAADPQGAQASILSIPFQGVTIPQPYPSNQKVAEDAEQHGTTVLTVGNNNDLLWLPSQCLAGQQDFTQTQWLEDEGSSSGIYARNFTSGILNCFFGLTLSQANHFLVLSDANVMLAIREFIAGAAPASLSTAPPGPDPASPTWSVGPAQPVGGIKVAAVSPTDIWTIDGSTIDHGNGVSWDTPITMPGDVLEGIDAVSATDIWVVGYDSVNNVLQTLALHTTDGGQTWTSIQGQNVGARNNQFNAVAGVLDNQIWAAGYYIDSTGTSQPLIEFWNGSSWSVSSTPVTPNVNVFGTQLTAIAVTPTDAWAVGLSGVTFGSQITPVAMELVGGSWQVVQSPVVDQTHAWEFTGVAIASSSGGPADVWAVGTSFNTNGAPLPDLIEHYTTATGWQIITTPQPPGSQGASLSDMSMGASNDIWAAGAWGDSSGVGHNLIKHFDGSNWTIEVTPDVGTFTNFLNGIAATGPGTAAAVGSSTNSNGGGAIPEFLQKS